MLLAQIFQEHRETLEPLILEKKLEFEDLQSKRNS